jgi:hypothetical protein
MRAFQAQGQKGMAHMVTVLTRVQLAPQITKEEVYQAIEASIPYYQSVPGLLCKAFTLSEDNKIGGAYLFESQAAAEAHFDEKWYERVRRTYNVEGEVLFFDSPVVLDNTTGVVRRDSSIRRLE